MYSKLLFTSLLMFAGYAATAQVGIGTDSPNASTQLHVVSNNKGILIPQVPLTSTTDAVTITSGNVESLLVYNTSNVADVAPGYYFWYNNRWNRLVASGDNNANSETLTSLI